MNAQYSILPITNNNINLSQTHLKLTHQQSNPHQSIQYSLPQIHHNINHLQTQSKHNHQSDPKSSYAQQPNIQIILANNSTDKQQTQSIKASNSKNLSNNQSFQIECSVNYLKKKDHHEEKGRMYFHRRMHTKQRNFKLSEKYYLNHQQFQIKTNILKEYEKTQIAEKIPIKIGLNHLRSLKQSYCKKIYQKKKIGNNFKDFMQFNYSCQISNLSSQKINQKQINSRRSIHSLREKNLQQMKSQIRLSIQSTKARSSSQKKQKKLNLTLKMNFCKINNQKQTPLLINACF